MVHKTEQKPSGDQKMQIIDFKGLCTLHSGKIFNALPGWRFCSNQVNQEISKQSHVITGSCLALTLYNQDDWIPNQEDLLNQKAQGG